MVAWLGSPLAILWLTFTLAATAVCLLWSRGRTAFVVVVGGIGSLVAVYHVTSIPLPRDISLPQGSVVFDRDGKVIGTFSEVRRVLVDTRELPRFVTDAVVAAEDRGFYDHGGVSFTSVIRASLANLRSLTISQGGSTITQQYVKNAILEDGSRTWTRKVREAVLAVKLEDQYTKTQILDFYLNTIYFGRGVYGIETAARAYFGKPARKLALGEAAYLAGIIRSPEHLQPDERPDLARQRRDEVLQAMADEDLISRQRARAAIALPLDVAEGVEGRIGRARAAYFLEWIRRELLQKHIGDCLYECGLQIHTTLDLDIQKHAEHAVQRALDRDRDPDAALVAMTPGGEVLAFVGGRPVSSSLAATGFNFASDYPGRHAGSALKPFTLLAALEQGIPATSVLDGSSPLTVTDPACAGAGGKWHVQNYGGSSYGPVTLSAATALSVNTAYARLAEQVGPDTIANVLERFAFDRSSAGSRRALRPLCSLALGALDVTPLEMTRSYAALAAGGVLPATTPIAYVADETGHCVLAFVARHASDCDRTLAPETRRVAAHGVVSAVTQVLQDVAEYGTGAGVDLPRVVPAVKTGTSQGNTDAWLAGYTDDLAATVWVGYRVTRAGIVPQMRRCDDHRLCRPVDGTDVTGGTIPANIWEDFMRNALAELAHPGRSPGASGAHVLIDGPVESRPQEGPRDEQAPSVDPGPTQSSPSPPPPSSPTPDPLPVPVPRPTRDASTFSRRRAQPAPKLSSFGPASADLQPRNGRHPRPQTSVVLPKQAATYRSASARSAAEPTIASNRPGSAV